MDAAAKLTYIWESLSRLTDYQKQRYKDMKLKGGNVLLLRGSEREWRGGMKVDVIIFIVYLY